jgi:hypothetical protein
MALQRSAAADGCFHHESLTSIIHTHAALHVRAGTHAISIKDLPSHPEVNCNTPAVRAAFASCALPGATAACCKRLDDVFAEPSSQSYA